MKAKAGRELVSLLEDEERGLGRARFEQSGRHYRLLVTWKLESFFLFGLGWTILIVFSLGIALFFLPYAVMQRILNGLVMIDDQGQPIGRLSVEETLLGEFGHIATWFIIHVGTVILGAVTLGLGFFLLPAVTLLYYFSVARRMVERTQIASLDG